MWNLYLKIYFAISGLVSSRLKIQLDLITTNEALQRFTCNIWTEFRNSCHSDRQSTGFCLESTTVVLNFAIKSPLFFLHKAKLAMESGWKVERIIMISSSMITVSYLLSICTGILDTWRKIQFELVKITSLFSN